MILDRWATDYLRRLQRERRLRERLIALRLRAAFLRVDVDELVEATQ